MKYIAILILIALAYILVKKRNSKSDKTNIDNSEIDITANDYCKSYQKRYLLTKNEWHEYKKLKLYADSIDLLVFPKVRLLDIIEPRRGEGNYMSLIGRIQSKHVDFLICDKNIHILGVIELDDNSHNLEGRKKRDEFVDQILLSVGYIVVHTRGVTENTLDAFCKKVEEETSK